MLYWVGPPIEKTTKTGCSWTVVPDKTQPNILLTYLGSNGKSWRGTKVSGTHFKDPL